MASSAPMKPLDVVRRALSLIDSGDMNFASFFGPDCELVQAGIPGRLRMEQFTGAMQMFKRAFPDLHHEITAAIDLGENVCVELVFSGTNTGPLMGPAGEIPPTGRRVGIQEAMIFKVKNGQIVSLHVYTDQMTMPMQLGLMPPPR
jgi:predicted ester cyclase